MEQIGHIAVTFIRTQEQADRERKECLRLEALPGGRIEAAMCRRRADALQRKASELLGEYQRLRKCEKISG